jgi:hypothetical protein
MPGGLLPTGGSPLPPVGGKGVKQGCPPHEGRYKGGGWEDARIATRRPQVPCTINSRCRYGVHLPSERGQRVLADGHGDAMVQPVIFERLPVPEAKPKTLV